MNYYLVKCKFGHVGRDKYLPLNVPIVAESVKKASERAKQVGGVKRDHKDWCLVSPIQIEYEDYIEAFAVFRNDIYFEKHSRSRLHLFENRLVDELHYTRQDKIKINKKSYQKHRDRDVINYKAKKEKLSLTFLIREQLNEIDYYLTQQKLV